MIITITVKKGGCGKTATVHALAAGLALGGATVLMVDLDQQCNLSWIAKCEAGGPTAYDWLTGAASLADCTRQVSERLAVLPASVELGTLEVKHGFDPVKVLSALMSVPYHYIIVDTPPALGRLTLGAMAVSDALIIPVRPHATVLSGLVHLSATVRSIREKRNPGLKVSGLLLTQFETRRRAHTELVPLFELAAAQMESKVFASRIRKCAAVEDAGNAQMDIFSFAPRSNAAADYLGFIQEFLKGEQSNGEA